MGKLNTRQLGSEWEKKAAEYLIQNGCSIIDVNYRCRLGEIDIIMQDGDEICFVEVKYRTGRQYGCSVEAVNRSKQQRIRKSADYYITTKLHTQNILCRFDVLGFDMDKHGNVNITHIKNAF